MFAVSAVKLLFVGMWQQFRDVMLRAIVLWSSLQGTRRQIPAVVTLLIVDASLAIPVSTIQQVEKNEERIGVLPPIRSQKVAHSEVSHQDLQSTQHAAENCEVRQSEGLDTDEDTNWWAWVAFAHTIVDAILYVPWHQLAMWLANHLRTRILINE